MSVYTYTYEFAIHLHIKMYIKQYTTGRVTRGKTPHFNFLLKFIEATVCGVHIFCAYFPTDKKLLHQWHSFCRR